MTEELKLISKIDIPRLFEAVTWNKKMVSKTIQIVKCPKSKLRQKTQVTLLQLELRKKILYFVSEIIFQRQHFMIVRVGSFEEAEELCERCNNMYFGGRFVGFRNPFFSPWKKKQSE